MKTFSGQIFSVKTGLFFLIAGIASLFFPHISGWNEIVFPYFSEIWFFPYLLWEILFALFLGLTIINFIALFFLKTSTKYIILAFCFPVILIILFLRVYPNFSTGKYLGVDQRVSFFAVGGQTRILRAGGAERVRNDALLLLDEKTDDEGFVSSASWSSSIKALRAYAIRIDKTTQSVIIYIPRANTFDPDQFVYLITDNKKPTPSVLQTDGYRYWELDEGVYFFQTW